MKKLICLVAVLLALLLSACGSTDGEILTPNANGSSQGNNTQNPVQETIEPAVLLEQDGLKIQAKELVKDGLFGPELKILIENESGKNLTVQCRNASINGYMVETMISAEVASGKKSNDSITFMSADLERCGIETIADMEFSFHVFTTEDWDTYLDSDSVQVKTSAADGYSYTYDHAGTLVYEGKGIKVIAVGLDKEDSLLGPGLLVYIHNAGDQAVTVQSRETSVNGFMVDAVFSQEIQPGKHAVSSVTFMDADLEENEITKLENVELSFHILNSDTWKTIADTETVKLSFSE